MGRQPDGTELATSFLEIAHHLDLAGLVWHPEIGDEITDRDTLERVSILVNTQGLTPRELRSQYLWLPTLEQMVVQLEARQAILEHTGLEISDRAMAYKTVVKAPCGEFLSRGQTLRLSVGIALRDLLTAVQRPDGPLH